MTSSPTSDEVLETGRARSGNRFSICDDMSHTARSMRLLERLAQALDVPIETFFEDATRPPPSRKATPEDIAELTRAFVAVTDPVLRRHCLDVVRAAGAREPADIDPAATLPA